MKIKINLDDPHTRAVWESAQRAKEEVASWPAWKRGEIATERPSHSPSCSCTYCAPPIVPMAYAGPIEQTGQTEPYGQGWSVAQHCKAAS